MVLCVIASVTIVSAGGRWEQMPFGWVPFMYSSGPAVGMMPPPLNLTAPTAEHLVPSTFTEAFTISDVTGDGILSFQFNVQFDPNVINPSGSNFGCSTVGTIASNAQPTCNVVPNTNVLRVVWFHPSVPLSGSGPLLRVTWTTAPQAMVGNVSPLMFLTSPPGQQPRFFNDTGEVTPVIPHDGQITLVALSSTPTPTSPTPTPTSTPTPTPTPTYAISGSIAYRDGGPSVNSVTMTLTGTGGFITQTATTGSSGNYSFTGIPAGNTYTLTPSKTGAVNGLESFDASFVARFVAGLDTPTANQVIAGDADGDGILTSFDASLIARYVAGLPNFGSVSTWKFVPGNRMYASLGGNQMNQDFTAILVGEISGNWFATGPIGGAPGNDGVRSWNDVDEVSIVNDPVHR
jgi:hypothetical protein